MAWTDKQREARIKEVTKDIYVLLVNSYHTTGSGGMHGPVTYADARRHAIEFVTDEEKQYP